MSATAASVALDLAGGAIGSNASKKASKAMRRAAEQQLALMRQQYYTSLNMNDPYYVTGTGANNLQAQMWGLPYQDVRSGVDIANANVGSSAVFTAKNVAKMLKQGMSVDDIAKMGSFNPGKKGVQRLTKKGVSPDQLNTLLRGPQGQVPAQEIKNNAPGEGGAGPNFDAFYRTPAYQWNLGEALRGTEQSAAARSGALSGNTARALQGTASGLASNEFWNVQNFLSSLSGRGQDAAGANQNAGQFYASGGANAMGGIGDAKAAGTLGQANSWMDALRSISQGLGGGGAGARASGIAPGGGGFTMPSVLQRQPTDPRWGY